MLWDELADGGERAVDGVYGGSEGARGDDGKVLQSHAAVPRVAPQYEQTHDRRRREGRRSARRVAHHDRRRTCSAANRDRVHFPRERVDLLHQRRHLGGKVPHGQNVRVRWDISAEQF